MGVVYVCVVAKACRAHGVVARFNARAVRASLSVNVEPVRGRLVFVFQSAEESLRGARAMLDTGLMQRLAPREFYLLHCSPFPSGTIGASPGYGLPGLDHIRIALPGGHDAAAALTAEVARLGTLGPRPWTTSAPTP
jgi:metal-dependent amidase/aminoacylase/carboxypeptidase family protein